jgi:DNA-binding transcriptional LysR family regulator
MPELRHLRAFIAVAEERSFTAAARRLHIAQQAVSRTVAALEAELGVALLRRTTREVSLTTAGAALLRSGAAALAQVDAAFVDAAALGQAQTGTVRVGITPAVGTAAHPRIAAALTDGAPRLQVTFREMRPAEATAALRAGDLDLVISRVGPTPDEFGHAQLPSSPAVALVRPEHRLAGHSQIAVSELDGEVLQLWVGPGDPYTDDVLTRLEAGGAGVRVAVAAVIGGGGAPTLAPDQFALRPAGWPTAELVALAFTTPGLELPLWVHWPLGAVEPAVERLRVHLDSENRAPPPARRQRLD